MYIHNLVYNIVMYNEFSHCLLYNSSHSSLLHSRVCNVSVSVSEPVRLGNLDSARAPIYRATKTFCIHTRTQSKTADLYYSDG